jgi:hypothetical protein
MKTRVKLGDVIEIATKKGLAYAQYTHQIDPYGCVIRIFDRLLDNRPKTFSQVVQHPVRFYTFFPLAAALNQGLVERVSNQPITLENQKRPQFLYGNPHPVTNKVKEWFFWLGGDNYEPINELTDQHRQFPIVGAWNLTLLKERIEEGWTPELDLRKLI